MDPLSVWSSSQQPPRKRLCEMVGGITVYCRRWWNMGPWNCLDLFGTEGWPDWIALEMTPAWCDSHMLKLQMTFTFLRFPAWLRLIWCFWLPFPLCFATWSTTFSWSRKPTGSTGAYSNLCSAADQQTPGNDASKFGGWTVVCRVADVGKVAMAQFRGLGENLWG